MGGAFSLVAGGEAKIDGPVRIHCSTTSRPPHTGAQVFLALEKLCGPVHIPLEDEFWISLGPKPITNHAHVNTN